MIIHKRVGGSTFSPHRATDTCSQKRNAVLRSYIERRRAKCIQARDQVEGESILEGVLCVRKIASF